MQEFLIKAAVAIGIMKPSLPLPKKDKHIEECAKQDAKTDYATTRVSTPRTGTPSPGHYWSTLSDEEDSPTSPVHRNTWMTRSRSFEDYDGSMDKTTMGERAKEKE